MEEAEIGRALGELTDGGIGLRIYRRGEALGFWEAEKTVLEAGDVVVEIVPTEGGSARP